MNLPKFAQLHSFATEILYLIEKGEVVSVEQVCNQIEDGAIVNFINNTFGFKNMNTKFESITDVNEMLKAFYVSEQDAEKRLVNKNGLVYIMHLILEDLNTVLYDMKFNNINPDEFRFRQ